MSAPVSAVEPGCASPPSSAVDAGNEASGGVRLVLEALHRWQGVPQQATGGDDVAAAVGPR